MTNTSKPRRTYAVECPLCGTAYQSTRSAAQLARTGVRHSCSAPECLKATADAHNAALAAYQAERVAQPRRPRPTVTHVPATDGNYLAMLMGATKIGRR